MTKLPPILIYAWDMSKILKGLKYKFYSFPGSNLKNIRQFYSFWPFYFERFLFFIFLSVLKFTSWWRSLVRNQRFIRRRIDSIIMKLWWAPQNFRTSRQEKLNLHKSEESYAKLVWKYYFIAWQCKRTMCLEHSWYFNFFLKKSTYFKNFYLFSLKFIFNVLILGIKMHILFKLMLLVPVFVFLCIIIEIELGSFKNGWD